MITIKKIAACAISTGATGLFCLNLAFAGVPITQWTQAKGVQVFLAQSPAIPMVDVRIEFDAGGRRDPADKPGLANLMASSTAYGVRATPTAPALDENALSDAWADLGASFGGGAGADRLQFSLRSLTYPDLLAQAVALATGNRVVAR